MLKASPSTRPARMETARQSKAVASTRRLLLTAGLLAGVTWPMGSSAKDYKDAKEEKEARRKKLREAMEVQAKTGKAQEAFQQPEYSVPEEARTSNWSGDRFAGNQMEKGNQ